MLGGALGSAARFLVASRVSQSWPDAFPWGTLTVNLSGSFLLGLLVPLILRGDLISPTTGLALTVGLLGGFTTFSSFSVETVALLQNGAVGAALANVSLSVLGCLAASWLGLALGSRCA
jgi:fluoride exporter